VDETPGTTRDLVEETLELAGVAVTFVDTAGLRQTSDRVEKEGVQRTQRALAASDLILHVVDAANPALADIPADRSMIVLNKIDLADPRIPDLSGVPVARVSATSGLGIDALRSEVARLLSVSEPGAEVLVTSERHAEALSHALASVERAVAEQARGAEELAGVEVEESVRALGSITGEDASQDLVDAIFARFCIGK
jgi:tRNA modification GTPase